MTRNLDRICHLSHHYRPKPLSCMYGGNLRYQTIGVVWGAVKWKPNIRHKTHPSQKLATLLLRIDTAICRVRNMHSENAQVHKAFLYCPGGERSAECVRPVLEMEASKQRRAERRGSFLGGWGCWNTRTSSSHSPTFPSLNLRNNSFSKPSVTLPTSRLILQPFCCFTYVTAHSPTLFSLLIRHCLFT